MNNTVISKNFIKRLLDEVDYKFSYEGFESETITNKSILVYANTELEVYETLGRNNFLTVLTSNVKQASMINKFARIVTYKNNLDIEKNFSAIKNIKFDLIIICTQDVDQDNTIMSYITNKIKFDECVCCAKTHSFSAHELYKHIESYINQVNPEQFSEFKYDGHVIAKLNRNEVLTYTSYEELKMDAFCNKYKDFYRLNFRKKPYYTKITFYSQEEMRNADAETIFLYPARLGPVGFGKNNTCDVNWNIYHKTNKVPSMDSGHVGSYNLQFGSKKECENLTKFCYNNPLANEFIKGTYQQGPQAISVIPNIDFSVDRDYENISYKELIHILSEERNI